VTKHLQTVAAAFALTLALSAIAGAQEKAPTPARPASPPVTPLKIQPRNPSHGRDGPDHDDHGAGSADQRARRNLDPYGRSDSV
jgi:hypothetical protein